MIQSIGDTCSVRQRSHGWSVNLDDLHPWILQGLSSAAIEIRENADLNLSPDYVVE